MAAAEVRKHRGDDARLIAYLHLRRDAGDHTQAVLEGHIRSFAEREGYELFRLVVARERLTRTADRPSDDGGLRELLDLVHATSATAVLVVGPARQALVALHKLPAVRVLTLAQVRPVPELGSTRPRLVQRKPTR